MCFKHKIGISKIFPFIKFFTTRDTRESTRFKGIGAQIKISRKGKDSEFFHALPCMGKQAFRMGIRADDVSEFFHAGNPQFGIP